MLERGSWIQPACWIEPERTAYNYIIKNPQKVFPSEELQPSREDGQISHCSFEDMKTK
jgi:hypothetical protein